MLRLPVRSLLRFSSVCKQWNNTIASLSFMRDHFHNTSNKGRLLIYWFGCREQQPGMIPFKVSGLSLFTDEPLEQYDELDPLLLHGGLGEIYDIVGPCNGVFCVANKSNQLSLWNLSTRKVRPLSSPQEFNKNDEIGFGVDPLTDEFKIVLIHRSFHFSIYTSSTDSWRYCESEPLLTDSFLATTECGTTFSQGFFYWRKRNNIMSTSVILAFDMCNEVFLEIEMPSDIRNEVFLEFMTDGYGFGEIVQAPGFVARRQAVLDLLEDSIALFCFDSGVDEVEANQVDVWLMKERGCWTRLFSLNLAFNFHRPLGFWKGNRIIFSSWDEAWENEELVMHDPNSGNTRMVRFSSREDVLTRSVSVFNYKESLFP